MLTKREVQVLKLIAEGLSTKEIAFELGIGYKTADCHRLHLMAKLDLHCTALLVRYAIEHGLLNPEPVFENLEAAAREIVREWMENSPLKTTEAGLPPGLPKELVHANLE